MEILGKIALCLILGIPGYIYNGYIFSILWEWFIVSTFNLPVLSIPVAIGISLVIRFFIHRSYKSSTEFAEIIGELIGNGFVNPTIFLGIGYVIHCFI
jgi:hypothetical protein